MISKYLLKCLPSQTKVVFPRVQKVEKPESVREYGNGKASREPWDIENHLHGNSVS